MYKCILALICVLFIAACDNNEAVKEESMDLVLKNDTIFVKESSPILKQIIIQKVQLNNFSAEFHTVGTVRPVSGKLAEIIPPFAGRITKTYVGLGQKVSTGSPVFELSCSEFYEAAKGYFTARAVNEVAQRKYNRQKELAVNGVASQKDLEESKSEAHIALQELEQSIANLNIFNIDVDSLQMGQSLKIVSPIAGEVVQSNITIGGYVREDSEPLAVVANLSKVWVAALVKEKYFGAIKHGDRVEVYTNAHPNKTIWGTIHYIGEILDEETRSLEVIVECNNFDREMKLGMFCEVHFLSSSEHGIILPATAVMQEHDNVYVLIEIEKGRYVRRKVEIESVNGSQVCIISGITEGENVVIEGGIYLI